MPSASVAVKAAPPERKKGCTVIVMKAAQNTSTAAQVMGRIHIFFISKPNSVPKFFIRSLRHSPRTACRRQPSQHTAASTADTAR